MYNTQYTYIKAEFSRWAGPPDSHSIDSGCLRTNRRGNLPTGFERNAIPLPARCPSSPMVSYLYHTEPKDRTKGQNQRIVRIFSARRTKGRLSSLSGFAAALAACAALSPRPQAASEPQLSPFERASPHSSGRTACGAKKNRTCSGSFFTEVPVLKRESIFSPHCAVLSLIFCSTDSA